VEVAINSAADKNFIDASFYQVWVKDVACVFTQARRAMTLKTNAPELTFFVAVAWVHIREREQGSQDEIPAFRAMFCPFLPGSPELVYKQKKAPIRGLRLGAQRRRYAVASSL
jgi:hypothetical protein